MNLAYDKGRLDEICRKYQVEFLGVFGSVARGEDRPDSDVDLLVSFVPESRVSLLELVQMEGELELMLGKKVDLVTRDCLSKYFRDIALSQTRPIYG
jgi:uncharacterized protein